MAWRVLLLAMVAACSPYGNGAFECTQDQQCGAGGTCSAGFCSFGDSSCPSGQRYGSLSGGMSNTCVGAVTPDAAGEDLDAFEFKDAHVAMDGTYCYGTSFATACFTAPPTGMITLQNQTINTDTSALCSTTVLTNPPWCVIAANEISVAAGTVGVVGSKPLVLIAVDTLDVAGTLSAASTRTGGEVIGASADYAGCNAGTPPTATKGGGGAGGSFGGNGGDGGDGNGANTKGTHGTGQTASMLRGGCIGQNGDGNNGAPGHGGGVIALVANTKVTVEGNVNASGEAGQGGMHPTAGGGGGGAGGLIVLDAPTVTVTGAVVANGGGGAEGSGVTTNDGADGNDPTLAGAAPSANTSSGGQGGAGGAGATPDGKPGTGPDAGGQAGGGGGGSVGVIKLSNATAISGTGGTVSPPAT